MRILVCPGSLRIGGSRSVAIDLAAAVRDLGHHVMILAAPGDLESQVRDRGLPIEWHAHPSRRVQPDGIAKVLHCARAGSFDLVHTYGAAPSVEAFLGPYLLDGVPMVTSAYPAPGDDVPGYWPRTPTLLVGRQSYAASCRERGFRDIVVLRPVVDVERFRPGLDPSSFRSTQGLGDDVALIVLVSRLPDDVFFLSGVKTSIEAVVLLARERAVRLVIVGDGPAAGQVRALADNANADVGQPVVTLAGALSELRPVYASADVVLAMATSAVLGAASGRPVVVLGAEGRYELFEERTAARYSEEGVFADRAASRDPGGLAALLGALLSDRGRMSRVGDAARRLAVRYWGAEEAARSLEQVYARAVARPTPRAVRAREAGMVAARYARARAHSVVRRVKQRGSRAVSSRRG